MSTRNIISELEDVLLNLSANAAGKTEEFAKLAREKIDERKSRVEFADVYERAGRALLAAYRDDGMPSRELFEKYVSMINDMEQKYGKG